MRWEALPPPRGRPLRGPRSPSGFLWAPRIFRGSWVSPVCCLRWEDFGFLPPHLLVPSRSKQFFSWWQPALGPFSSVALLTFFWNALNRVRGLTDPTGPLMSDDAVDLFSLSRGWHHRYLFSRTRCHFERVAAKPPYCIIIIFLSLFVIRAPDNVPWSLPVVHYQSEKGSSEQSVIREVNTLRGEVTGPGPF